MSNRIFYSVIAFIFLATSFFVVDSAIAQEASASDNTETELTIYFFGRDDCGVCKAEKEFLDTTELPYQYLNIITDDSAKDLFLQVVEKHNLSKITPVTIVGDRVFQGFNGPAVTGKAIEEAYENASAGNILTLEEHISQAPEQKVLAGEGCDENGKRCSQDIDSLFLFSIPFVGVVDFKAFSLASLSMILGTIDGFNPCAMWVLVTFLVLLSQAGSRRKMVLLAGIFIVAEGLMYNLILNVWYKTWDFIALDQIVTPLVGLVAFGGGVFFLYRWHKNRNVALVCDISDIDSQNKTIDRFKRIVHAPVTLATFAAILVIAFSVNIIEFACSIGIPQAYTKILDINMLSFLERQFYILIYTFGYMLDDLVVFGLAIWGYSKLEAHGHRFAQWSLLIGGTLMVLLGAILFFDPTAFVL